MPATAKAQSAFQDNLLGCIQVLRANPPCFQEDATREDALLSMGSLIDANVREGQPYDLRVHTEALWEVFEPLFKDVLDSVQAYDKDRLRMWQWYSSGVIFKLQGVVMAFDTIATPQFMDRTTPRPLTTPLAAEVDMLFITHHHPDHYDPKLIRECLNVGKPVFMPESLCAEWESNPNLYAVSDGFETTLADMHIICRHGIHVWRDTHEEVPLVYYEITLPNGYTFMYVGDIDYTKMLEKTPGKKIDLMFLPWRAPNAEYEEGDERQEGSLSDAVDIAVQRIHPGRIIYLHCGELEHVCDGFPSSYDLAIDLKRRISTPLEILFWGECIDLL